MDYRELEKETLIVFIVIIIALSFWSGAKYTQWRLANEPIEILVDEREKEKELVEEKNIYVHVAGAVKNPGVYMLPSGSRVEDVLKLAEPTENAQIDKILNRAALVQDSDKIYVPSMEELVEGSPVGLASTGYESKISLNRATEKELEALSGIGPAKAKAIVDYRESSGGFKKIEDLMNVKGIGPAIYEGLKEEISL